MANSCIKMKFPFTFPVHLVLLFLGKACSGGQFAN